MNINSKRNLNKKGFLLAEETLKIVLALIAIIILVYFLVSLYLNNKNNQELKRAKDSLEYLEKQVNNNTKEVELYNPEGYWLVSWPHSGILPISCTNFGWEDCICICDNPNIAEEAEALFTDVTKVEAYAKKCKEKGVCIKPSKKITIGNSNSQFPIKIEDPPLSLNINYGSEVLITKK